jgi:hypothetical protein
VSEPALPERVRAACAAVAERARLVSIDRERVLSYAAELGVAGDPPTLAVPGEARAERAAFVLTLDAINFGSGWWPTIRRRPGLSGYRTIEAGLRERFEAEGPWTPDELAAIEAAELARVLGQDPGHELMVLYADALRDLGRRAGERGGFLAVVDAAGESAAALCGELASWPAFADSSRYGDLEVPFYKRAQIAAADLHHAGVASFADLGVLTIFADNVVPHVLRVDGVLRYAPELAERVDRGELLEHGSPEEVEIRACAVHAVELIAAARPDRTPAQLDYLLWNRGQDPRYKARPRHRARTTAY